MLPIVTEALHLSRKEAQAPDSFSLLQGESHPYPYFGMDGWLFPY